jgi:hypothetical protein
MCTRFLTIVFLTVVIVATWGLVGDLGVAEEHHGHKAHHGGILNVIGKELAHIEVRIQGDTLEAWFVGGGQDTGRSVQIEASRIPLTVTIPGRGQKNLILEADPLKLAGEKMGYCSHFLARAGWLKELKEFEAKGSVVIKGVKESLIIQYPTGYDPLHRHGNKHHGK